MPPKSAKKFGPGAKRAAARRAAKAQAPAEEAVTVVEAPATIVGPEVTPDVKIEEEVEVKLTSVEEDPDVDINEEEEEKPADDSVDLGESGVELKTDVLQVVGELELDDVEPEYEQVDYGEKAYDDDDVEEDLDIIEEDPREGDIGEEVQGYAIGEDNQDIYVELEGVENDGHAVEERAEMYDAVEEGEHHDVIKERRKRKEFEIFVGGLEKNACDDDLKKVFSEVGEVTEVRLLMNPLTKKNKGFAFLRFATAEQAKRACTELANPVVRGKKCGVTPSQDTDTLFLGNICKTWTKDTLRKKLMHYGVMKIEELTLVDDSNNKGTNRGFAFLEFSSRFDAMDAFKLLQKRDVSFGVNKLPKVSFADTFFEPDDEIMAQVKTIFVDGLSASWDEDRVEELLGKYGKIEKIELSRNMPSAKRKDFGFVTFDTHDAAISCARNINNEELGDEENKVKVRARLSRPLQRGRGKQVKRDPRLGSRPVRSVRRPSAFPALRPFPVRTTRVGPRGPSFVDRSLAKPAGFRYRQPVAAVPPKTRPVARPPRSFVRRPPVPLYPRGFSRDYDHREELPLREATKYSSQVSPGRRFSYRDDYSLHGSRYSNTSPGTSGAALKGYVDRHEREYRSMSGSKRPYSETDDMPLDYGDTIECHSRARLAYDFDDSSSRYRDAYTDRLGRPNQGYGSGRSSNPSQVRHGPYSNDHGMGYVGGSYNGGVAERMYPERFGGDYPSSSGDNTSHGGDFHSRGSNAGGGSYSSLYHGRGLGGGSYMGSGSSRYYY